LSGSEDEASGGGVRRVPEESMSPRESGTVARIWEARREMVLRERR